MKMKVLGNTALALGTVAALGLAAAPAQASSPNSALKCFTGGSDSTCDAQGNEAHLVAEPGSWAGVYINGKRVSGKSLNGVDFSFDWSGTISGGAPRLSIAIDEDGDGAGDGYAFLDAANCGGTSGGSGSVSTDNANCLVYYGTDPAYANWDAFAAANPSYTIARDISFVIVDWTADVELSDVTFQVS